MIRAGLIWLGIATSAAAQGTAQVSAVWDAGEVSIEVTGQTHAQGRPVTALDAWHIGSITKSMTATLAARLVSAGKLDWDSTLGEVLQARAPWADVTLEELLSHRSGMAANLPTWRAFLRPDRAQYVEIMLGSDPAVPHGTFLYSNAGYTLAGAMLEAVGGAPWEDLLAAEVFGPLGMEGMGFGAPADIWGFRDAPVPPGPAADNLPAMGPAGTVHGPPSALLAYLEAHLTQANDYLPETAWQRLHRPQGDYALGWGVQGDILFHAGSNTMWMAQVAMQKDRAVFVATNAFSPEAERWVAEETLRLLSDALPATPAQTRP